MIFRRFTWLLALRLTLVGLLMGVFVWLLLRPGLHGATLIAFVALALVVAELWRFVSRTNREVARFLDAARYADFSQRGWIRIEQRSVTLLDVERLDRRAR